MSARSTSRAADQQKKVGKLSGGERNRVHLAKMLKTGGNVLLLDEPTNDLDVETLARAGRRAREFRRLRRHHQPRSLVPRPPRTHILAFEGDSHVEWFEGNFEAYEKTSAPPGRCRRR
jgi:ABC-type sugar transport system ATPase subunit